MAGPLGCAQEYRAAFHWRGGAQLYGQVLIDELTDVEWSRTVNDVSDAKIRIARQAISPECCEMLGGRMRADGTVGGGVEPWIHELTLWRDKDLVWQGPVLRAVESRSGFTVEAVDVVGWLDRVVNTLLIRFTEASGSNPARLRGPVTKIAETIVRRNLTDSKLSKPADWPGILDYLVRIDTKQVIRFEKDGSSNKAIWNEYVGVILRELNKRGLLFTTVGRSLVLRGKPSSEEAAVARLSLNDFLGDIEVIRDGTNAATASWATNQDTQNISKAGTYTEVVGKFGTEYGRLDSLVKVSGTGDSEDKPAEIRADLRQAAKTDLEGRYPAPIAINVPQGAQLSPNAPVSIHDLVGGERLDVVSAGWCTQIGQGFMLSDLNVTWSDGAGEKVGVSLVPLSDPYGDPVDPYDGQTVGVAA
ncbi:hypothetical protein ACFU0X_10280 [Streptomyces cellulosae]|uniref:Minor tail protein n=1 Tax=Streptomyces cellulosae TaxID=1968 RepID=A0ABW6JGF4_STRCE